MDLDFLGADFDAMAGGLCHLKVVEVSRDKKGEPLSEAPLFHIYFKVTELGWKRKVRFHW
jgi:hypothetical protein